MYTFISRCKYRALDQSPVFNSLCFLYLVVNMYVFFSIGTPQSNANLYQSASWKTCRLRLHLQIVVLLHNLLNCDVLVSRTTLNALNDEHHVG